MTHDMTFRNVARTVVRSQDETHELVTVRNAANVLSYFVRSRIAGIGVHYSQVTAETFAYTLTEVTNAEDIRSVRHHNVVNGRTVCDTLTMRAANGRDLAPSVDTVPFRFLDGHDGDYYVQRNYDDIGYVFRDGKTWRASFLRMDRLREDRVATGYVYGTFRTRNDAALAIAEAFDAQF